MSEILWWRVISRRTLAFFTAGEKLVQQTYTRYSLDSEPVCIKSTYNNNKDLIFLVNPYGHNEKHEYKYDNHNNIIFHCVTFVDTGQNNTERYEITYY